MNFKSFLHFKILSIILLILFSSRSGLGQILKSENRISELKKQVLEFNNQKNMNACASTLVKILSIDSTDVQAQRQLTIIFRNFFDEISTNNALVDSCLIFIKDSCNLPLFDLLMHYYKLNNFYAAVSYLEKFQHCGFKLSERYTNKLLSFNSMLSPDYQLEFFKIINESSDTLIKIYSVYLAYQIVDDPSLGLSGFCKSIGISKDILKNFFLPQIDSLFIFLGEKNPGFNVRAFNNFIALLKGDSDNGSDVDIIEKVKNIKNEFFNAYNQNDVNYLEKFISKYKNEELSWKFSFEDLKNFLGVPQNSFFYPLAKIILNNLLLLKVNNVIYEAGKLVLEKGLFDESKNIFNLMDFNVKSQKEYSDLLPLIFSSYILNQDSIFITFSKEFILSAKEDDFVKLKEELIWWKDRNIKIDLLEKALLLFSNETINSTSFTMSSIPDLTDKEKNIYYALLIAIEDYEDDNYDLRYPINDALELKSLLMDLYSFNEKNVITLFNPKRSDIIRTFTLLKNRLTASDNLLIFYAGHGNWDEVAEQGYWLPADAKPNDLSEIITNTEITSFIKSIKAKHTLLISDACFSGSIFKTRDAFIGESFGIDYYQSRTARKAITSGALTPVPDKSIFIEYLLKSLRNNQKKYLTSEELFLSFREAVINNSPLNQRPLFGNINDSGDEGGDFVFIKK